MTVAKRQKDSQSDILRGIGLNYWFLCLILHSAFYKSTPIIDSLRRRLIIWLQRSGMNYMLLVGDSCYYYFQSTSANMS